LPRRWPASRGVVDIRGDGLMIGIELDRPCGDLVKRALERRPADQRDGRQGGAPAAAAGLQRCRSAELVSMLAPLIKEFLGG
jgi:acetylornithine/N-succinyldiaminopimelate aminotransferase